MTSKLIDLYKNVICSNKNIYTSYYNERWDINDIFNKIADYDFGEYIKSVNHGLIQAKTLIVKGQDFENLLTIKTGRTFPGYTYTNFGDHLLYEEDLKEYYNGHEFEPTTIVDFPMNWINGVGIAFHGMTPNLLLYPTYEKEKISDTGGRLKRYRFTLFGKKARTIEYKITLKYYLKFGNIYETITKEEYLELVDLAKTYHSKSNNNLKEDLLKEFSGK